MTVTLSLISEHAASKYHTGVLALGWSKNDHQPVFDHFMNEVSQLCTPKLSYCKLTNSFLWVAFGLCFYLADRPEHDAQLNLLGHGGATSKPFGHVSTYKSTTLPSCDLCYKARVRHCQSGQPLRQCNTCTGWTYMIIPKHQHTVHYCMGIKQHRCLTLYLQFIRLPMNNTLYHINHRLNVYHVVCS